MASSSLAPGLRDISTLDMEYIDSAMSFTPSERCTISCGTVCIDPQTSKVLIIFNRRLGIWQLPKGRKNIGEDLQPAALRETYEETGVHATLMSLKVRTRSTTPVVVGRPIDEPQRSNNTAFHRATPSTESASSMSTACNSSVASTTSSTLVPPSTVAMPKAPNPQGSRVNDEHETIAAGRGQRMLDAGAADADAALVADPKLTFDVFNTELVGIVQYPDIQAETPNTVKIVFFFAACADSTAPMGPGAQDDHEDLFAEWVSFQTADSWLRFKPEKEAIYKVRRDMERSGQ